MLNSTFPLLKRSGTAFLFFILTIVIPFAEIFAQNKDLSSNESSGLCDQGIEYHIGYIDPAYQLSRKNFKVAIKAAGELWSEAVGKTLISYNKDGNIPINLIYSDQQRLAEDIENLRREIDNLSARHDSLERRVKVQKDRCSEKSKELESKANHLTNLMKRYNQRVRTLNRRGNITGTEQAELEEQKKKLGKMQRDLRSLKRNVEDVCNKTERMVADLNDKKEILNSDIATFNKKNKQLKEFKRGLYTKNGEVEKIEIYHYNNEKGLILTLAHELGHALGLQHSDDPQSIMYYRRTEQNGDTVALSKNDVESIRQKCNNFPE